ncbi:MAG TPA: hypothetical protein P5121_23255 [Caldilineaceae bacterium]|nr:hypothetical protein [Caldilineaceae bacterium]
MQVKTNHSKAKVVPTPAPSIAEEAARRIANGYLSRHVGVAFGAAAGVYIPLTTPVWQFAIEFRLPRMGQLGIMGTIDINIETGSPLPLSATEIRKIQDRANAIVQFQTQATAA